MPNELKPYFIRAIKDYCEDNNQTLFLTSIDNNFTNFPKEYIKNGQLTLNLSAGACINLSITNEYISFSTRFNGIKKDIIIPLNCVTRVFSKETGQGIFFNLENKEDKNPPDIAPSKPSKPKLTIVK